MAWHSLARDIEELFAATHTEQFYAVMADRYHAKILAATAYSKAYRELPGKRSHLNQCAYVARRERLANPERARCSVAECNSPVLCKGMCDTHYRKQLYRTSAKTRKGRIKRSKAYQAKKRAQGLTYRKGKWVFAQ